MLFRSPSPPLSLPPPLSPPSLSLSLSPPPLSLSLSLSPSVCCPIAGSYETCCTADSKSSSHTLQKTNEITPDQHSMKRKISSLQSSLNEAAFHRRKQLKSHHNSSISRLLPTSPASLHESNNSSDEENIHSVSIPLPSFIPLPTLLTIPLRLSYVAEH